MSSNGGNNNNKDEYDRFVEAMNNSPDRNTFRGFLLGGACGFTSVLFMLISFPLSIFIRSWKFHPRYHMGLFMAMLTIASFGINLTLAIAKDEISNVDVTVNSDFDINERKSE